MDFEQATAMDNVFVCNAQVACKALEKEFAIAKKLDQEIFSQASQPWHGPPESGDNIITTLSCVFASATALVAWHLASHGFQA